MSERKVVRIEIEYEDGEIRGASGEVATQIWKWISGLEIMNYIHGAEYRGPKMEQLRAPQPKTD